MLASLRGVPSSHEEPNKSPNRVSHGMLFRTHIAFGATPPLGTLLRNSHHRKVCLLSNAKGEHLVNMNVYPEAFVIR